MIRVSNESDFKNWFKKNYRKLGFTRIIKSDSMRFPDFIMLKNNKRIKVELEIKSSHFILHNHNPKKVDLVICVIKDKKLSVPIIRASGIKVINWGDKESFYSIKRQVYQIFKKEDVKVLSTSEVASLMGVNWNTAEKALLELVIENKIERFKKEGVNLWMLK